MRTPTPLTDTNSPTTGEEGTFDPFVYVAAFALLLMLVALIAFGRFTDRAKSAVAASDARQLSAVQAQAAQLGYSVVDRERVGQIIDPMWLTVTDPGWIEVVLRGEDGRVVVARQEGSALVLDAGAASSSGEG